MLSGLIAYSFFPKKTFNQSRISREIFSTCSLSINSLCRTQVINKLTKSLFAYYPFLKSNFSIFSTNAYICGSEKHTTILTLESLFAFFVFVVVYFFYKNLTFFQDILFLFRHTLLGWYQYFGHRYQLFA